MRRFRNGYASGSAAIAALVVAALAGSNAACAEFSPRGTAACDARDSHCDASPGLDAGRVEIGPFGPIIAITGPFEPMNVLVNEDDATLTEDLLEMYFNSDRDDPGGPLGIWVTRRSSPTADWGAPIKLDALDATTPQPTDPVIAPDGLTIWLASDPGNGNDREIYRSTRSSRESDDWTVPERVASLSSGESDRPGGITADGATFVLLGRPDSSSDDSLMVLATRESSEASWSTAPPDQLEAVHRDCSTQSPSISPDGRILIWTGSMGACGALARPFVARRDSSAEPFVLDSDGQSALDAVIGSGVAYSDPWLSADGGYLILTRTLASGERRLFHAVREGSP